MSGLRLETLEPLLQGLPTLLLRLHLGNCGARFISLVQLLM